MTDPQHRVVTLRSDDLREFMIVLRRALLLIVKYIEKKYGLNEKT